MTMKHIYRILAAAAVILPLCLSVTSCHEEYAETTEMDLSRCLQPMNLKARVNSAYGNRVTFSWDVTKDADSYNLVLYSDKAMTKEVMSKVLSASEVPYVVDLDPDATFYFKVQATSQNRSESKWAEYDSSIKTYAVKDNLYLKVSDRQAKEISLSWSKEVSDYKEVDRIDFCPSGSEESSSYTLTSADIESATATISGLDPSVEYVITLYYASASRGQVCTWTLPSKDGLMVVADDAALAQGLADGANIYLTMEGSPYTIASAELEKGYDLSKGVKVYGEGAADGTRPVVYGTVNITDSFDGGDIYFENVEFNGKDNACGFAFQHKEGSTTDGVKVGSVTYKNCGITAYSKGLFYEWGKTLSIGEFTFDSCDIWSVNGDGSGGGDGFDVRNATEFGKLSFINNTIYTSFRTFLRFDASPVVGDVKFENNTVMNLCFADNTNNAGLFAFQTTPASLSLKNNLFLNMGEKATMTSANAKYTPASDLNITAARNYFYGCPDTFFTTNFSMSAAAGTALETNPCFNAEGGYFNILADSEIAGEKIGASKWWTAYVEEPTDLRLTDVGERHTWDFTNAKYFIGDVVKGKVSDLLAMYVENCPMNITDGILNFTTASVTTRKGVPTDGFLAFKVSRPGSVIIQPVNGGTNHVVVAVGDIAQNDESTISSSAVTVKGGASETVNGSTAQKIILSDITEESIVYIYCSGPIGLKTLAWSDDIDQVNTALGTPAVTVDPKSVTSGEATEVTVTWEAVDYAGTYSVIFNGSTSTVEDALSYAIPAQTIGFLDAGAYKVEVIANPKEGDVYNTPSAAGVAAFAIVPAGGSGDDEFVVKSTEELLAAIAAGKTEITLAAGTYETGALAAVAGMKLSSKEGAEIKGAIDISGSDLGELSFKGITFTCDGTNGNAFNVSAASSATSVTVESCTFDGFSKSVWYDNTGLTVSDVTITDAIVRNAGTGQGMFDIRKGSYGSFTITESTITGGRDLIRADANTISNAFIFTSNTVNGSNLGVNSNGIMYVRATPAAYVFENNLFLNEVASGKKVLLSKASGVTVPTSSDNNFFYNYDETNFFSGLFTEEVSAAVVIASDPVKDAANGDYTLTNSLAMVCKAGASRWNPSIDSGSTGSFAVNNADEFNAAIAAGKTDLTLAAGTYELGAVSAVAGMRLSSTEGAQITGCINIAGEDLGNMTFDGITFAYDGVNGCAFNVSAAASAGIVTVKNCTFDGFTKSVLYDNAGLTATSVNIENILVKNQGTGQGVFDLRKSKLGIFAITESTVKGGRDLVRADAGTITDAFSCTANTIDGSNLGVNGNAIMYVRATPASYVFKNNLFLNEIADGKKVLLSKASGITVPTMAAGNYVYSYDETNFFSGLFTQEVSAMTVLAADPVKDSANGDYTVTDSAVKAAGAGASRWR